ncbi:hypothetical protein C4577_05980 [Candidatus Parcubacteria bacterium]|nr:MAG: hypothetical protein C4577_05980 [Candidatus Parcubacteria bacterium]
MEEHVDDQRKQRPVIQNECHKQAESEENLPPLDFKLGEDPNYYQIDLLNSLFLTASSNEATKVDIDDFRGIETVHALKMLSEIFLDNVDISRDDLSVITRRFMDKVVPNPPEWDKPSPGFENFPMPKSWRSIPLWERAWEENIDLQKVVCDVILQRAEKDTHQAGNSKDLNIVRHARELLRLPSYDFLSEDYQGTSSAALPGIGQARGKICSLVKLKELGIVRRTGEGFKGGANLESSKDGISVSRWFEMGDAYSSLCCDAYHRDPAKERIEIERLKTSANYLREKLNKAEIYEDHYDDIKIGLDLTLAKIAFLEEELAELEVHPPETDDPPFPIVFGLKDLPTIRAEDFHASRRVGHEIDLHSQLGAAYATIEQVPFIRSWLQKLNIDNVQVYPLESVRLIRKINPQWDWIRKKVDNFATGHTAMLKSYAV